MATMQSWAGFEPHHYFRITTEIRSVRTYQVQVEAVLDNQQVQITPTWYNLPQGAQVSKARANLAPPEANFLQHVGLDWQVLVGEELISYSDYKKRVVLQKHGMSLDGEGEITVGGVRLKDTMPQAAYDLFLKGLEAELATAEIEVPKSDRSGEVLTTDIVARALYGELEGKALTQAKTHVGKTLWSGANQGRWQSVLGQAGAYTLGLEAG